MKKASTNFITIYPVHHARNFFFNIFHSRIRQPNLLSNIIPLASNLYDHFPKLRLSFHLRRALLVQRIEKRRTNFLHLIHPRFKVPNFPVWCRWFVLRFQFTHHCSQSFLIFQTLYYLRFTIINLIIQLSRHVSNLQKFRCNCNSVLILYWNFIFQKILSKNNTSPVFFIYILSNYLWPLVILKGHRILASTS